jgi:hypothetical protein
MPKTLDKFSQLDDFDIMSAIKAWQFNPDFILSSLSKMILIVIYLKIKVSNDKFDKEEIRALKINFLKY